MLSEEQKNYLTPFIIKLLKKNFDIFRITGLIDMNYNLVYYENIFYLIISKGIFSNIKTLIIKMDFLKLTSKKKTCFICKSKLNCTTFKLKNCGHYIHMDCFLTNFKLSNMKCPCGEDYNNNEIKLIKTKEKDTCSICLDETNTVLECGHHFHKKCIKESMKCKKECPYCRKNYNELKKHMYSNVTYRLNDNLEFNTNIMYCYY